MRGSDNSISAATVSYRTTFLEPAGRLAALCFRNQKACFASGMVPPRPDRKGLDHVFTFSAVPGPRTCFEGVQLLAPGHCLRIAPGSSGTSPVIAERAYWEMDFPAQGEEEWGNNANALVNEFRAIALAVR